jgi:nucleotide-binding universal stress UspA family protein|nr:universal stress protein [Kofleriaceae bacterium]
MVFKKILCPVDFSAGAREALTVAARIAVESSAALVLVHVWELPTWAITELTLAPAALQDLLDSNDAELARWKAEAAALGVRDVQTRSETGPAWDRIVAVAGSDPGVDLVVMGTHGRTGLSHALIGSVAEKVVRFAPCNVLVVRPRAA